MERHHQPRLRPTERLRKVGVYVFNKLHPEPLTDWHPSRQRDVGKSASAAAGVQLVIEGLRPPERNVQRINGERVHLHALSDESLERYLGFAFERRTAAEGDICTIMDEQARRDSFTADVEGGIIGESGSQPDIS